MKFALFIQVPNVIASSFYNRSIFLFNFFNNTNQCTIISFRMLPINMPNSSIADIYIT